MIRSDVALSCSDGVFSRTAAALTDVRLTITDGYASFSVIVLG
jgi:hypothetical protein